jgi:hypothetical protein
MRGRAALVTVGAVALCAWCGWVSALHRTSGAAETTWLVSLAAVVVVDVALWRGQGRGGGWRLPRAPSPWPRSGRGGSRLALRGVAPWLVLILVAVGWDVLGIDTGPRQYHLTVSALAQAYRPLNAALVLVWMLVGIGYEVARLRAPCGLRAQPASAPGAPGPDFPEMHGFFGASALRLRPPRHPLTPTPLLPSRPPVGVAFWVCVPIVAVGIDLVARRSDGRLATAEEFFRFVSTSTVAHLLLVAAWVFAGYHLFAR